MKSYVLLKAEKNYSLGFILSLKDDLQGIYFIEKRKVKDAWNFFFTEKAKMRYVIERGAGGGSNKT